MIIAANNYTTYILWSKMTCPATILDPICFCQIVTGKYARVSSPTKMSVLTTSPPFLKILY